MTSKNERIALPYAEAFLDMSGTTGLDKSINDLKTISQVLKDSQDLKKTISNPILSSKVKKDVLKAIFSDNVDKNTTNLLYILCDRGRIAYLSDIVETALELAYKKAKIEMVSVKSSIKLTQEQEEALSEKVKRMTKADKVNLEVTVDESLIGGFVIQIGSKTIDTSIKNQLQEISLYLGVSSF
jgi:F-type H+-transporting ATPase subunit delta